MGDNDADKRPRMYGQAVAENGKIEVTVKGGEGETTDDIEGKFERAVERMLETQGQLPEEEPPEEGFE